MESCDSKLAVAAVCLRPAFAQVSACPVGAAAHSANGEKHGVESCQSASRQRRWHHPFIKVVLSDPSVCNYLFVSNLVHFEENEPRSSVGT